MCSKVRNSLRKKLRKLFPLVDLCAVDRDKTEGGVHSCACVSVRLRTNFQINLLTSCFLLLIQSDNSRKEIFSYHLCKAKGTT